MAGEKAHLEAGMNQSYSWKTIGIPAPQGSKRHVGGGRMIESCKALKPWREAIIADAKQQNITGVIDTPVGVSLVFCFPRPKRHYGKNGTVLATAPTHKTTRPDLDKLTRGVLDSLVYAGMIADDSLVYSINAHKRYCIGQEAPGVLITVMDTTDLPFRP